MLLPSVILHVHSLLMGDLKLRQENYLLHRQHAAPLFLFPPPPLLPTYLLPAGTQLRVPHVRVHVPTQGDIACCGGGAHILGSCSTHTRVSSALLPNLVLTF